MAPITRFSALLSHLILVTNFIAPAQSTYYLPNGTEPNDNWAAPCSTDASSPLANIACHTKWDNPPGSDIKYGPTKDECMPNGLCQNRGSSSITGQEQAPWTHYYRVYCTDPSFKGCLDVCSTGYNGNDVAQLTPCDGLSTSEKWCCGATTDCCAEEFAYKTVFLPQNFTTATNTNGLAPVPTPTSNKLSGGAIAGIAIGVLAGIIALLALGFLLGFQATQRRWRNKGGEIRDSGAKAEELDSQRNHELTSYEHRAEPKAVYASHELDVHGRGMVSELSADRQKY